MMEDAGFAPAVVDRGRMSTLNTAYYEASAHADVA
jgi:hypothetical protein